MEGFMNIRFYMYTIFVGISYVIYSLFIQQILLPGTEHYVLVAIILGLLL